MSATQDTFDGILTAVAHDVSIPNKAASREAVRVAILAASREHHGRVTAATIRPHLPTWVATPQVGAVMWALQRSGHLLRTGQYAANGKGGKARNRGKRSPVYTVPGPIPAEAVQP